MSGHGFKNDRFSERGAVLVIALAVLTLLVLLGLSFLSLTRLERAASANHLEGTRARLIALAGLNRAVAELHAHAYRDPVPSLRSAWVYRNDAGTDLGVGISLEDAKNPSLKGGEDAFGSYSGVVGGTYAPLGDRYKLRISDQSAQVDLGLPSDRLAPMLNTLGQAIAIDRAARGLDALDPVAGRGNRIVALRDSRGGLRTEEELLEILTDAELLALRDYVALDGWTDPTTSRFLGIDPSDGIPRFERQPRAPVCVNSAPRPVLIACLAGVTPQGGAPITFAQAAAAADEIIRHRASDAPGEGPLTSWQAFYDLVDGLAVLSDEQRGAIKVNANPNLTITALNPDRTINLGIDKSHLAAATTELCFYATGLFEVESLGLVHDADGVVIARRALLSRVEVFDLRRIDTQSGFETARVAEEGTTLHASPVLIGLPSPNTGYVATRPAVPDHPDMVVCDLAVGPNVFDLIRVGGGYVQPAFPASHELRLDAPDKGGDLLPDGALQSAIKQRGLSYPAEALPRDAGSLAIWLKLDRGAAGASHPIVRWTDAIDAQTGLQLLIEVASDGTDLRVRSERLFYDRAGPLGGEPAAVPYANARTVCEATLPGKGVFNEWHRIELTWSDGTSHSVLVDRTAIAATEVVPASEGASEGHAPYEPGLRVGSGESDAGDRLFCDLTIDDVVIRDAAAATTRERFSPIEEGVLARFRGAFPPLVTPTRVGRLGSTVFVPTTYENQLLPTDLFGVQLRLIVDGVEYAGAPGEHEIVPGGPLAPGPLGRQVEFVVELLYDAELIDPRSTGNTALTARYDISIQQEAQTVGASITSIGGRVRIQQDSVIDGDVYAYSGDARIQQDAVVTGDVITEGEPPDLPSRDAEIEALYEEALASNDNDSLPSEFRDGPKKVKITDGETGTIGAGTYLFEDFQVQDGATVQFEGDVTIVMDGNFHAQHASQFLFAPGANVKIVFIDGSFIWQQGSGTQESEHTAAQLSVALHSDAGSVRLQQESSYRGSIYAPDSSFILEQDATVTGQVVVKDAQVHQRARLVYEEIPPDEPPGPPLNTTPVLDDLTLVLQSGPRVRQLYWLR